MKMKKLIIFTGASGSGKSVVLDALKEKYSNLPIKFLSFDSAEIPSPEQMESEEGSVEDWQLKRTYDWLLRIKTDYLSDTHVLFEGQMRVSFLKEALENLGISHSHLLLLDCSDSVRAKRLKIERNQADLLYERTMIWAEFLREEAQEEVVCTIDTTDLTCEQMVECVCKQVDLDRLYTAKDFVEISDYDPSWSDNFTKEKLLLEEALEDSVLDVHHIGSTSVPGLAAKPKIDILCVVESFSGLDVKDLEAVGYLTRGEVIPGGRYFKKKAPEINLHVFEQGNPLIEKNLLFRDWLREHSEDREAYAALKKELSEQFAEHNGLDYCHAKTKFIEGVIAKAEKKVR
jgi:GrpB-like predicted nucleotidyltransferase (UPF0157 family)